MSNSCEKKKRYDIPIWCKSNLSIEEAAAYSGIGMGKLYEMTELHKIRTLFDRGSVPTNRVPSEKQRLQVVKSERTLYAEGETRPSKQRSGRNTRLSSPPVLQEGRL